MIKLQCMGYPKCNRRPTRATLDRMFDGMKVSWNTWCDKHAPYGSVAIQDGAVEPPTEEPAEPV